MDDSLLGASFALSAAVVWSFAMILFKQSGDKVPPLALNLFKNTVALILLSATLYARGLGFETMENNTAKDFCILALSGFLGIAVADTLFFYSLNLVGVGIVSIVDCLYSPLIILFSFLLLSEKLTALQYFGAGLVLLAVAITSRHAPPQGRTRKQIIAGVLLGVLTMGVMTFSIVFAKPVLANFSTEWATTIRMAVGTAALSIVVLFLPQRRALWSVFRPSKTWKVSLPGSVLGAYLSSLLWIAGFKYAGASVAGVLNQTSTIFALLLATLILKESFTRRKFVAMVIALGGIVLVTFC